MKIRLAQQFDMPEIISVQSVCYRTVKPERLEVLSEKLGIYPKGCLVAEIDGRVVGYMFSHPWRLWVPPEIDSFLGCLPKNPDCFYIHDVAVLPTCRGLGIARDLIEKARVIAVENHLDSLTIIAVQDSENFWEQFGFRRPECENENIKQTLSILKSYQEGATYMIKFVS